MAHERPPTHPRASLAGGSLHRYMQIKANPHMHDGGGLPEPLAATITSQLAAALVHMHGLGVAHRDVKPENVAHI